MARIAKEIKEPSKKITKIEPKAPAVARRKRVAAYARVSLETDRLNHSLSAQISYYSKLIQANPMWEYAGVYADRGISGTGIKDRTEFQRLLADCEAGCIDIVLTKSISRFARNTVDLLGTVRHLKDLGIEVRFEKEHISTFSGDGELMLSILASFAQEESRSISDNCKWGIRKRFQSGKIGAANKHILGYQYNDELGKYEIIPDEAVIVERMFQLYLDGVSLRNICDDLNSAGYRTTKGRLFSEASLNDLLHNEIYAGDLRRQKSYMADPITKIKVRNNGELPQYVISDSHEAIIDRETYALVQAEIKRRTAMLNDTYCFTGIIRCGICGMPYTRHKQVVKGRAYVRWICRSKKEAGTTCRNVNFSETELQKICAEIMGVPTFDEAVFTSTVKEMTVLTNGDMEFQCVNGETKLWNNLHLNPLKHVVTVTDAFQKKIICAHYGNTYHRVNGANRWVYWYCMGKKKKGTECSSPNFADFRLRIISAAVMGTESFDEAAFTDQIDHITVLEDGGLEYRFQDGRTRIWQKQ